MHSPVFIDIHGKSTFKSCKTNAKILNRSCTVCNLVNSLICPVITGLETIYAFKLWHTKYIKHLSQMIDSKVKKRSMYTNFWIDEIRAEERHIISRTSLTPVAYASCMINFTKFAFFDHLLCNTCLRIVDGTDLNCQLFAIFLLCIIENLCICIACRHWFLGIAVKTCCHNSCCNRCMKVVMNTNLYLIDIISL